MRKIRWLGVLVAMVILLVGVSGAFAWRNGADIKVTPPAREFGLTDFLKETVEITVIPAYEKTDVSRYMAHLRMHPADGYSLKIRPVGAKIKTYNELTYELEILFDGAGSDGREVIVRRETPKIRGRSVVIPVRVKIVKYCGKEEALRDLEKVFSAVGQEQKLLIKNAFLRGSRYFRKTDLVERYSMSSYWLNYDRTLVITFALGPGDEISVIEEEKE